MNKYLVLSFNARIHIPIAKNFRDLGLTVRELTLDFNYDTAGNTLKILQAVNEFKPEVIFSFGWWDRNIDFSQYEQIIKASNCVHVYWTHDDPEFLGALALPMAKISSCIFTTDGDSIDKYSDHGIKAEFLPFACDPFHHKKVSPQSQLAHDIVLLANNYNLKDYIPFPFRKTSIDNILVPVLNGQFDIAVFGQWWLDQNALFSLPSRYHGGHIKPGDEANVYSSCKIALGIMSVGDSKSMLPMRVFEVLGCGAFFLTQYTPALERFFVNHRHMIWSNSPAETLNYIKYFLAHPELREIVAREG